MQYFMRPTLVPYGVALNQALLRQPSSVPEAFCWVYREYIERSFDELNQLWQRFLAAKFFVDILPIVANIIREDCYVDDIRADTVADATECQTQLIEILNYAEFLVYKWSSNSLELLHDIPEADRK